MGVHLFMRYSPSCSETFIRRPMNILWAGCVGTPSPQNLNRPSTRPIKFSVDWERNMLYNCISNRVLSAFESYD